MNRYTIINNSTGSDLIEWGNNTLNPGERYELLIDNVDNGQDVIATPQFGILSDQASDSILKIEYDTGQIVVHASVIEAKAFIAKYYNDPYEALGQGDMRHSLYDPDWDGVVDAATSATYLGGHDSAYYATSADIPKSINDLDDVNAGGIGNGQIIQWDDATNSFIPGDKSGTGATTFIGLDDTPTDYAGSAGKAVVVTSAASGVEFVDFPSGNVDWGDIGGTLSNQTDLQSALDDKENAFTKNTAFNKNFGTTAGTVAEGNHNHDSVYVDISGDTMTGDLTVPNIITSGQVDGRDVSVDGAKLDTITDVGSGKIITDSERTKLLNAMDRVSGATQFNFANFADSNGQVIDSGYKLDDNNDTTNVLWSASKIKSEIGSSGGGTVIGPSQSTDGHISIFNGTSGQVIADGGMMISELTTSADFNTHTSDTTIHFTESSIDHTNIQNVGTNTHTQIDDHISATDNPHSVTKDQVGLGNVDNTSDLDKPISTATQTALDDKEDKLIYGNVGQLLATNINKNGYIWVDDNSGGQVDEIIAGAHIHVNNTDPVKPIVSVSATDITDLSQHSINDLSDVDTSGIANEQILQWDGNNNKFIPGSKNTSGGGDVSGPNSSVGDAIVLFDGGTGKVIKDSGVLLSSLTTSADFNSHTSDTTIHFTQSEISYNNLQDKPTIPSSIDDLSDVDTTTTSPTTGQLLEWNGTNWVPVDKPETYVPASGNTADRPSDPVIGFPYFATDLGYPIFWNDTNWVNASGGYVIGPK